jgi:glucuronokinase
VIVETCAARAALAGNPSDGYGGAVVSVPVAAKSATVSLRPSGVFEIDAAASGIHDLVHASIRTYTRHRDHRPAGRARPRGRAAPLPPCAIDVRTTIPRSVGLAGSSAIVIAVLRALAKHDHAEPFGPDELASLALAVEVDELGFAAGLQDRVVQAYDKPMLMQFDPAHSRQVAGFTMGTYSTIDQPVPGSLYVAYRPDDAEPSDTIHRRLRSRFDDGDRRVHDAMSMLAEQALLAHDAIRSGDVTALGAAMDASFDIRRSVMDLRPGHIEMIEVARRAGAWANFAGSGGAVTVLVDDATPTKASLSALRAIGCDIVGPVG